MNLRKMGVFVALAALAGCAVEASGGTALEAADDADGAEVGEVGQELRPNGLKRQERATVLKLIDDICGDTWCEGDHNFSFDRLECQKGCRGSEGTCKLTFRVFSYDTDLETGPVFKRSCQTSGFDGFESLVQTTGNFSQLQPDYYAELTDCISQVEAALPD